MPSQTFDGQTRRMERCDGRAVALGFFHDFVVQVQDLMAKCNAGLKAEADKHKKMFGNIFQKKESAEEPKDN